MTYEEVKRIRDDDVIEDVVDLKELSRMIDKAVDKQIAKKPEFVAEGYADGTLAYDYAKCPVCKREFEYNLDDWGCAFCQDCGQALDWSGGSERKK